MKGQNFMEAVKTETAVMKKINHENIIKLKEVI